MPELVHIPFSPWSFRARVALEVMGVPHRSRTYTATLSEPGLRLRLRRLGGRVTLPVPFREDGPPLEDSFDIVCWGAARSERPLVTDGDRDEIRRWNQLSSAMLEAGRARTTVRVMSDPVALRESLPPLVRPLGPLGLAIGRDACRRLLRKYGAEGRTPDEWREVLRSGLEQLRAALAGREWLLGGFTYADLTAAAGLSFVKPHADAPLGPTSRERWTEPDLAEQHADLLLWRDQVIAHAKALRMPDAPAA